MNLSTTELENLIKALFFEWGERKRYEHPDKVRYSGPVMGGEEYSAICDALFDNWWSGGSHTLEAEKNLAKVCNRKHALLFNSGSSANLALMHAAAELYFKEGDKILTLAAGFPTTVNPIIHSKLIPVFVDIDLQELNLSSDSLRVALKRNPEIRGVFVAHTLGFPSEVHDLIRICQEHGVEIFFDCCDAYGTEVSGKNIAAYGRAASLSMYVAHHLTMGEGGAVVTDDDKLHQVLRGVRSWGRYCAAERCCVRAGDPSLFCPPGKLTRDSELPDDYIVNYQYEWMGFNLKPLDLQAAILNQQLKRFDAFNAHRRSTYNFLYAIFQSFPKGWVNTWKLPTPHTSPFAFPILIGDLAPFTRKDFVDFLQKRGIETRLLFGGNLTKHPAYANKPHLWEMSSPLVNSNIIMDRMMLLGCSQVIRNTDFLRMNHAINEFRDTWKGK